jgi:hypothetical protein
MSDAEFIGGLLAKPPRETAPGFVMGRLSIKREEMIEWLQARDDEWINADIKESRNGKWYVAVDPWKPQQTGGGHGGPRGGAPQRQRPQPATAAAADEFADDDIEFIRWGDR